jgi:hypothetical protein
MTYVHQSEVHRDPIAPAVLAELTEVQALVAAEVRKALEGAVDAVGAQTMWSPYPAGSPESAAWIAGGISSARATIDAIRALIPAEPNEATE